jgi:hypothetical protein
MITKKEAQRLAEKKWKYAMKTGCTDDELECWCEHDSELSQLESHCGYCDYFEVDCENCIIGINDIPCINCDNDKKSLFWRHGNCETVEERKEIAEELYNLIVKHGRKWSEEDE